VDDEPQPVPPAVARRQLAVARVVVWLVVLAMAVVSGLFRPATVGYVLMTGAWLIAASIPTGLLSQGWRPVVHSERFLTVRTLAGRRTVDLRRLVKIDRWRMISRGKRMDLLVLLDVDDMEIVIDSPEVDRAVVDLLPHQEVYQPNVSQSASHRLGLLEIPLGARFTSSARLFGRTTLHLLVAFVAVILVSSLATALWHLS
jgi:hypothetical protein